MTLSCPDDRPKLMEYFFTCTEELNKGFMGRHSREKPCGYAGDYQIIDWIYTLKCAIDGNEKLWDEFYHRQHAPQAVRNRKDYLCDIIAKLCQPSQYPFSMLNLACGPCRDIAEALDRVKMDIDDQTKFHCVDMDKRAIAYAQDILKDHLSRVSVNFEIDNVFMIKPLEKYDLVWSAGLFDYLNERQAVVLLKKMWKWTKGGGQIIFGNFHPRNPTRNYMEWGGAWFLIHRTKEDVLKICELADLPLDRIRIEEESLGVCIFCVISKPM